MALQKGQLIKVEGYWYRVNEVSKDGFKAESTTVELAQIIWDTVPEMGWSKNLLSSRTRKRSVCDARMIVAVTMLQEGVPLKLITHKISRYHSTILAYKKELPRVCEFDKGVDRELYTFREKVRENVKNVKRC